MKKIRIPHRPRPRSFREKFARDAAFFGSREKKQPPRFGPIPLLLLCLLGGLLLTAVVLLVGQSWKVTSVSAADGQLYSAALLLECADIQTGDEMLGFDSATVAKRLKQTFPLLDTVRIKKSLNGSVSITVTEETALYYTRHNVNYYILSARTRQVLCVDATPDEAKRVGAIYVGIPEAARVRVGEVLSFVNLPYAPDTSSVEYTTYEVETDEPEKEYAYVWEFLTALMDSPLGSRVVGMELGDEFDLWFVLRGNIKVRVGSMEELERKLMVTERSLQDSGIGGGASNGLPTLVDVSDPAKIIHRTSPDIEMPPWAD